MSTLEILEISTQQPLYTLVLKFRNRWLRQPLNLNLYDEDLSSETLQTTLIALTKSNEIVGCVMLQILDSCTIKLRQMAVSENFQQKGIGKRLVEAAETKAKSMGFTHLILHARLTAVGFYEKLGYHRMGSDFEEVTIPHIAMKKEIH
ncbi:MAG: GNAT family N-acetyltransferase [Bacteroidetes bacterium]|nr:GNAT family N-acetyltransferase [Bacteroidota bacterium]